MDSDFTPLLIVRLDEAPEHPVITLEGSRTLKGTIQGGNAVPGGAANGASHTGNALDSADHHTSSGVGKAAHAKSPFLKRAWDSLFNRSSST